MSADLDNSNSLNVLTVSISNFNSYFSFQCNLFLVIALFALIPLIILFSIFQ